jgi:hypothetical protein
MTNPPTFEVEARTYLAKYRVKINALSERFAAGKINRKQFDDLYQFYESKIIQIEKALEGNSDPGEWKKDLQEGQTILIRRKHAARLLGYGIYFRLTGDLLKIGSHSVSNPAWFRQNLFEFSGFHDRISGGQSLETGEWMAFISGTTSTTVALFSTEPSREQLRKLKDLHEVFENANHKILAEASFETKSLVCPHDFFLDRYF